MKTKLRKSKKKIVLIILAAVVLALILCAVLGVFGKSAEIAAKTDLKAYTVERGTVTNSITGSGMIEPIEQYEIQSIVTGDIIEDYVTLGATVHEDDVLYVIDSTSAENNIERAKTSYNQQVISYNDKFKNYNETESKRTVKTPCAGVITELYVENGDKVQPGAKLAEIKDTSNLTVRVPFLSANAASISQNQAATVYFDERNESVSGYVSHVATGTYATSTGAVVSDVEITIKNPGAILPGESATATVGGFACNEAGAVEESSSEIITAEVSGDVKNLKYSKGDNISAGVLLLNISDDTSDSDLRSSELSLKNSKLSLDDLEDKLDDYTIRSPISGTVISKTLKAGDTLDGNKSSLAIVADISKLTFDIDVDELDIKKISLGQKVKVTADALPDAEFEGVIDTISIIGTSASGVTVYPVTVVISEYEGLLPGMNVNAEIVTSEAENALMIPVDAVTRGNYVLVKDKSFGKEKKNSDKSAKSDKADDFEKKDSPAVSTEGERAPDAPEGYKYKKVELGISSEDFIQVKSGLSAGDVIYYTVILNTKDDSLFATVHGGGGMGGMGGSRSGGESMPSGNARSGGGMPSGGGMR